MVWSVFVLFSLAVLDVSWALNPILNEVITDHVQPKYHKVHNLILNPEQHSWCELKKIRQVVSHAQCESKEMENFVCVGTCFSYSVPQTVPEIPGDEMLDYCDSCQPAESNWTTVVLNCKHDGSEYQVTKNIQLITNCSCSACKPVPSPPNNDITRPNEHRINEIFYNMLPDIHPLSEPEIEVAKTEYSQVSLGDLKKEFDLDSNQVKLLKGKLLMKDIASFTDEENEQISNKLNH